MDKIIAQLMDKYRGNKEEIRRITAYLIVGGWNTLFGIGVYAILYELLHNSVNYLVLMIPANILAITNAYLCYKLFVFKTRGNYASEYLRCYAVYGAGIILSFILMFLLVSIFGLHPILAQCLCVVGTTIFSYIGHKRFSFAKKEV